MMHAQVGFKAAILCVAVSMLGCSSKGTIADLGNAEIELEQGLDFNNLDHEKVRNEYEQLVDLVDDQYLKEQIERRIAGVHMQEGDSQQTQASAPPRQGYYRNAIASYVDILEKYPNSPDNAEVLYQLAKAYDMEGQHNNARQMLERLVTRHPYYKAIGEAYFRLGDIYFSAEQYVKAETSYREAVRQNSGRLVLNSQYMLAWALYKQGNFNQSLDHFAIVLNQLLMAQVQGHQLTNSEKPLVEDTLHSMSLALVNLGGAQAIADIELVQGKPYQWRLYQRLADFYLEKTRYFDSAETYRQFISLFPTDQRASEFHSQLISAYLSGGFPKLVLEEKQSFVKLYGPASEYLTQHPKQKASVYVLLKQYYVELSAHFHSQGQKALKKATTSKERNLSEIAVTSLHQATDYYARYLSAFPDDKHAAQLRYKKAEAHFENQQYDLAAKEYAHVAYIDNSKKLGNKAAYASLVAFEKHVTRLENQNSPSEILTKWRADSVDSMLKFAAVYHQDVRAITVLTNAAQSIFALNQFDRAIEVAGNLLKQHDDLNPNLKKTAYGILAHSYFQKGKYQLAQNHYEQQRSLYVNVLKGKKESQEYKVITDQIAASIYKKSEVYKNTNKIDFAIRELLSIKVIAPESKIRVLAQYDGASLLLQQQNWKQAIIELKQLAILFPAHELAAEFPRKLAFAYEKNEQWKEAAVAYMALYNTDKDSGVRQDALFIAAGLERKIKNYKTAIQHYRDYAHAYEKPFDNRMEARYQLADLYEKIDDKTKHLYWLRRIIAGDETSGSERTERSRWLGAWANAKYGDYFAWEFYRRSLRQPIDKSIARKNNYIQDASLRYKQASEYGILEFVTLSNYKLARLYQTFSEELAKAPMPNGLSAPDEEVYREIITQQAQPFFELAISVHSNNIELSWDGHFNDWISKSYDAMKLLSPLRFGKEESLARYGDEIR